MGFLTTRLSLVKTYAVERARYGLPESAGPTSQEVIFVLDGVGGFQFVPLVVRKAFRMDGVNIGTIVVRWQFGLIGEIWTDLMWRSRNERQAAKLADRIQSFRTANPDVTIHVVAYSGGCGVALWACERLRPEVGVETLLLVCPAVSPTFNLAPALQNVRRCYALVSRKDSIILGVGTSIFGTTDRKFSSSAGRLGFRRPTGLSREDEACYDRLRQIEWSPDLRRLGNLGGHAGWASVAFLREHLVSLLCGQPRLKSDKLPSAAGPGIKPGESGLTVDCTHADG